MLSGLHKLIIAVLAVQIIACKPPVAEKGYYDIDSLIQAQASYLAQAGAQLHKHAKIDGTRHDTTFTPADLDRWILELTIFQDIDMINRPIHLGSYAVTSGLSDPSSNLTVRTYTAEKNLPLVSLNLYFLENLSKLRKLEAHYQQESLLLKSSRRFEMEFSDIHNKSVLTSYTIEGKQKMLVSDTVRYTIIGTVEVK
jgi:hypothetical protein